MNSNEFLNSLGEIDTKYVEEAAKPKRASSGRLIGWLAAAAAALALIAGGAVLLGGLRHSTPEGEISAQAGETAAPAVLTDAPAASTVVPFETAAPLSRLPGDEDHFISDALSGYMSDDYLIFNGSYYNKMKDHDDPDLAGTVIGEVTELVNSRVYTGRNTHDIVDETETEPQKAEYREHTGNLSGPIYAVLDYPSDYIVCQKLENGSVRVYFNSYKQEFRYAREILEDCFGVSRKFAGLEWLSRHHFDRPSQVLTEYYDPIDPALYGDRISAFMDALVNAEWRPTSEVFGDMISGKDHVAYLRIMLDDGMYVDLDLYEDGHAWIHEIDGHIGNGVLCLDKEAAEGIAELVRGEYVYTQYPPVITFTYEDAVNDRWLGSAVPKRIPDGLTAVNVMLYKVTSYELYHLDELPEYDAEQPTKYASIILRPQGEIQWPAAGGKLIDVHMDIVPSEDERSFANYASTLNSFVPIEEFTSADIKLLIHDYETPTYGAFVRCGGTSVRILVTVERKDAEEAQALIMELVNSIRG